MPQLYWRGMFCENTNNNNFGLNINPLEVQGSPYPPWAKDSLELEVY